MSPREQVMMDLLEPIPVQYRRERVVGESHNRAAAPQHDSCLVTRLSFEVNELMIGIVLPTFDVP